MGIIEHVLIATDLSAHAEVLLDNIAPLLCRLRPVVDLAHVWRSPRGHAYGDDVVQGKREKSDSHERHVKLAQARSRLTVLGARAGRDLLLKGDAAHELKQLVEHDGYDLIITGACHRPVSSVSTQLQRHATCPVLTVPLEMVRSEASLRILTATDLSSCSTAAAEMAASLALELGATLTLLYVNATPPIRLLPDGSSFPLSMETVAAFEHQAEVELLAFRQRLSRPGLAIVTQVVAGGPAESILTVAPVYGLVVMGTHGRAGWKRLVLGSVAERVSRRARVPVLIVRPPELTPGRAPLL
jgi:nucleotide-binding universal stress UspA family protein